MIDFDNATIVKLRPVDLKEFQTLIAPFLVDGERVLGSFKGLRDGVVMTDKRIICINIQGLTGKKKDFTSIPYSKIQAFSVETAGVLDLDSELEIYISGLGKVKLEFTAGTNVNEICRIISALVL